MQAQSLPLPSGLKIRHCRELWYKSQTWLGSRIAAAVVQTSSYSSNVTPSLGTTICHRCSPKKTEKKKSVLFILFISSQKLVLLSYIFYPSTLGNYSDSSLYHPKVIHDLVLKGEGVVINYSICHVHVFTVNFLKI